MYVPLDWLIIVAFALALSVKILRSDERIVIFRLGRFLKIAGPGFVWLIPVIDKGKKFNLSRDLPGWQALSETELHEKIKASVIDQPQS